mmetsp:Transcript_25943/g.55537  ORF Transcript_25943/g.55537 Transcript_25943/m.55537 type:complete len:221 (-) Transcript_25943:208-870(-)
MRKSEDHAPIQQGLPAGVVAEIHRLTIGAVANQNDGLSWCVVVVFVKQADRYPCPVQAWHQNLFFPEGPIHRPGRRLCFRYRGVCYSNIPRNHRDLPRTKTVFVDESRSHGRFQFESKRARPEAHVTDRRQLAPVQRGPEFRLANNIATNASVLLLLGGGRRREFKDGVIPVVIVSGIVRATGGGRAPADPHALIAGGSRSLVQDDMGAEEVHVLYEPPF